MSFLKHIYSGVTLVGAPAVYPVFRAHSRGKIRLSERYGFWPQLPTKEIVWFHGASLGEVRGLAPLIKRWHEDRPDDFILLTALSPTGLQAAPEECSAAHLLPFDHPYFFSQILSQYVVKTFIFGETELWPNILSALQKQGVPTHLVNGVLTEKSFRIYKGASSLFRRVLAALDTLSASDEASLQRFVSLGASEERAIVTGNTKYDRAPSIEEEQRDELKQRFFSGDAQVITLGSMHLEELRAWIPALKNVNEDSRRLACVIAPRHQERFDEFAALLRDHALPFSRRSDLSQPIPESPFQCLLLDTLGELESVYSFSDLAFVGGTLVSVGGHNPLEAASYGVPLVLGPYQHKIDTITQQLKVSGGMKIVKDAADIIALVDSFLEDKDSLKGVGQKAKGVWIRNQGASERIHKRVAIHSEI